MYDLFVQTRPDSGVKRTEIGHYIKELKQISGVEFSEFIPGKVGYTSSDKDFLKIEYSEDLGYTNENIDELTNEEAGLLLDKLAGVTIASIGMPSSENEFHKLYKNLQHYCSVNNFILYDPQK